MTVIVHDDGNEFTTEPIDSGEEPKEFGEEVVETWHVNRTAMRAAGSLHDAVCWLQFV